MPQMPDGVNVPDATIGRPADRPRTDDAVGEGIEVAVLVGAEVSPGEVVGMTALQPARNSTAMSPLRMLGRRPGRVICGATRPIRIGWRRGPALPPGGRPPRPGPSRRRGSRGRRRGAPPGRAG